MSGYFCLAVDTRTCREIGRLYDQHVCIYPAEHDGSHECGCGHRWSDSDA